MPSRASFPGIHYALPWPIDTVYKLKVRELRISRVM